MTKRYINVAYKDRDMAKRLGARWDPAVRRWYCPPGSALAKVYSWRKAANPPGYAATPDVPAVMAANSNDLRHDPEGRQLSLLG